MVAMTRTEGKAAFVHLMDNVFGLKTDKFLTTAITHAGYSDIRDVVTISDTDIDLLQYPDANGDMKDVPKYQKTLLKIFKCFIGYRTASNNPIENNWLSITDEEFDTYRTSIYLIPIGTGQQRTSIPASSPVSATNRPRDVLTDFKKGIKRDPSLYVIYRDEKQWDNWQRSTLAQARAQDVDDVLDSTYTPSAPDDVILFKEKQKFMYAVFERTLQTDQGKAFVRAHEADFDAQSIYKDLVDYSIKSTKASLDASDTLIYITTARIGDGSWNNTAHSFILHWQDKIRLYEKMVPKTDHFPDSVKRIMLENAVAPIEMLRAVKNQADQFKISNGKDLTYVEYSKLVLSAASTYDASSSSRNMTTKRRTVYNHDIYDGQDADIVDDDYCYNIDSDIQLIEANLNKQVNKNAPRLSFNQWQNLSSEARKIWSTIPDKDKAVIIRGQAGNHEATSSTMMHRSHPPRSANVHVLDDIDDLANPDTHDVDVTDDKHHESDIVAMVSKQKANKGPSRTMAPPPHDIRRLMSSNTKRDDDSNTPKELNIDGKVYCLRINSHITYQISASSRHNVMSSLVDRGANGGIAGDDVRVIFKTLRNVDIQGIDNHQIQNIPIVTAGGVVQSQRGPVIAILNQYAYVGRGRSIHLSGQLEWYKNEVNDRSIKVGGKQHITTLDGYIHPINIVSGLPYVTMRPYTNDEWDTLPHVIWTSDNDWDPSILDHNLDDNHEWFSSTSDLAHSFDKRFNDVGDYQQRVIVQDALIVPTHETLHDEDVIDHIVYDQMNAQYAINNVLSGPSARTTSTSKKIQFDLLQPYFGWLPSDIIQRSFSITTQFARMPMSSVLKKRYKSPNPAVNVHRRNEPVATDTVFSDTPAIDGGETIAQIFVGTDTFVIDVFGMKSEKQFINTLEDTIRLRGAPTKLISDRAQVEISNKVKDILRTLCISDWQSEPHQQHQNPFERRYQTVKRIANVILDRTASPPSLWLLCLEYVAFILNNTYSQVKRAVPLQLLTGSTNDISPLLFFKWYEPVYYKLDDSDFPSESKEKRGRWVGIAEHVGHAMTFKILTDDTNKILFRSNIRTACDPSSQNLRETPLNDSFVPIVKSIHDSNSSSAPDHGEPSTVQMPIIDVNELVGRTFLLPPEPDGQRFRARILRSIDDHENNLEKERMKFLCSINDDEREELLSYNDIMNFIETSGEDVIWKFKRITAHQGPLTQNDKDWKGSRYNVMIEWENGEITSEPLSVIAADDPVTCAIYAKENDLLHLDGWKRLKRIANRQKKLLRMVNQAKLRSFRTTPKYKFGFEIPRNYQHAMELDKRNGNSKWMDATSTELSQLNEYSTFNNLGHRAPPPTDYKKITAHLIYDCKHDGRHKARLVAGGHLTEVPLDSVYSGVVSLRGLRTLVFLGELNGLHIWATDIGNAYLEAKTKERVYIVAGPEFGDLEGHTLIIVKALYGLRTSGLRWHERFSDCLRDMGFFPSKAESDIWMRPGKKGYDYIGVYVDDLAIIAKDPESIIDTLINKHGFKLKGTGPIQYHLGMDFFRDSNGVLCISAKKYINKMISSYETYFGTKPSQKYSSPLDKGDHPELDTSEFLDDVETQRYQSLIGALQWAISIGRLDINTAVMSLSSFRAMPRQGHMDRVKRMYGYLSKMKDAMIRIRTEEPDLSELPIQSFDWEKSVYGNVTEIIPKDLPTPLGKYVTLTHYFDANLYHDMMTGRSVTGILHFMNKTPIEWYSKKQPTVETATYGSEFIAARTCVEQIVDLRNYLRYLGVPIREQSYMFGDNKTVIDGSTIPHAKLHKRHNALSFHRVREAVASGMLLMYYMPGDINPADILSKHWGYQQIWKILQPLLFYQGDTADLLKETRLQADGEY